MTDISDRAIVRKVRANANRSQWREDYQVPPTKVEDKTRADKRQRAFHSAKDYETSASQIGEIPPTEPSTKRKASIVVASMVPREEIEDMLKMLGLHPSQPDYEDDEGPLPMPRQFNSMDPKGG